MDEKTFKSPDGKLFTTNDGHSFTSETTKTIGGRAGEILAIDGTIYRFNACKKSEGQKLVANLIAVILAASLIISY